MATDNDVPANDPWAPLRVTDSYRKLTERLELGFAEFSEDKSDLRGAVISLAAAYDFLRTDPLIAPRLAEPLSALARALSDHLSGSRHPLLAVRTVPATSNKKHAGPGRGRRPSRDASKGVAVSLYDFLIDHHIAAADAATAVSRELAKYKGFETVTATTVLNWKEEIGARASPIVGDVRSQSLEWLRANHSSVGVRPAAFAALILREWAARWGLNLKKPVV